MRAQLTQLPDAVSFDAESNRLEIIDQRKLPKELVIKSLSTSGEVWLAINTLEVRGAPAIGLTAAFGMAMYAQQLDTTDWLYFISQMNAVGEYYKSARPTAVNLAAAVDRMLTILANHAGEEVGLLQTLMLEEAHRQKNEDQEMCRMIGEYAADLIPEAQLVMTYCNAGVLATGGKYGTALAPIYVSAERGHCLDVIACETRPVLQGGRLTAFELAHQGIPVTVICDNMAAVVMKEKRPDAVFVGADRIAANGDVANKIGTYGLALLAKAHGVPFYVCAPETTLDLHCVSGEAIPIEERSPEEIRSMWYVLPQVTEAANIYNPAFDITPAELITAIITEKGCYFPPYAFRE